MGWRETRERRGERKDRVSRHRQDKLREEASWQRGGGRSGPPAGRRGPCPARLPLLGCSLAAPSGSVSFPHLPTLSSSLPPGEGVGGNQQCWPGVRHLLEKGEGVGELGTPQERGQGPRPRAGVPQGAGGCSLLVPAPSREVSSRLQEGPHSASQ